MSTILFDIDGVLADFVLAFTSEAHQLTEGKAKIVTTSEQLSWDLTSDPAITNEVQDSVWRVIHNTQGWWETLTPLVGREVFYRISRLSREHQVVFGTQRAANFPSAQDQSCFWLRWYSISHPSVIVTKRKGELARLINADYAIEDKAENAACIHWMADSPQCKVYILDRPYNRVDYLPKRIKRISTVEEFLSDIEEGK